MKRTSFFFLALATLALPVFAQTADRIVSLQNVEIQGKRFGGLSAGEMKRIEVDSDLGGRTGTTADLFRRIPSLIADMEGGLTYRGSTHTGLLINDIPYGWLEEYSGDLLTQLPALFFDQVAVASLPGLSYVPDGDAGLLNLISEIPSKDSASPLSLTAGGGWHERYQAGAVLRLHPGRFHIVGKYIYRRESRQRTFNKSTTRQGETMVMDNNASARPDVHLADLTLAYDISASDRLTAYGLYSRMSYDRYGKIHNNKKIDETLRPVMFRHRYNDQAQEAYAAEARWEHTFADPEERLRVVFNYNTFAYNEANDYKNEKPETGNIVAEDSYDIGQKKNNYYLSANYNKTFATDWTLQLGYIGRLTNESYRASGSKLAGGEWQEDEMKTNDYTFDRQTHLLAAALEKSWGELRAEVGVQGELSRQKVARSSSHLHLYPRLRMSYAMDRAGVLTLGYVQRVIRPMGKELNPFTDRSDATHLWRGNPDLKNEQIHSLELGYTYTTSGFRLSPALFYRNKKNRIMETAETTDANETIWTKETIGHSQTVGFELSASWQPLRWLSFDLSGELYRDEIDGRTIGYEQKKSMFCGDIKGAVHLSLTPDTELQIDGFYLSDQLTPQGEIKHRSNVNAGISHYFMHRKLRANLSVSNLFDGLKETTIINTSEMHMTQVRNRDARVAWLTLTYNL